MDKLTKKQARASLAGMLDVWEGERARIFERLWANEYETESEKQVDLFRWWDTHGFCQGMRVALFHLSILDEGK